MAAISRQTCKKLKFLFVLVFAVMKLVIAFALVAVAAAMVPMDLQMLKHFAQPGTGAAGCALPGWKVLHFHILIVCVAKETNGSTSLSKPSPAGTFTSRKLAATNTSCR